MTLTTTNRTDEYTGTGANTALATTFPFVETDDVQVIQRVTATGVETTLTEGVHYTISGGSYAVGTVTPIDGATDFPSTVTWILKRVTDKTQETDYPVSGDFSAESHETALDKLTMLVQDNAEDLSRSLTYPVGDTASTAELPNVVDRASKSLGFDSSGEPVALSGTVSGDVTVTSFAETLLDDGSAAVARATLDAQEDVITTRGDIVRGSSAGVAERLALGTSGQHLESDGTDVAWATPTSYDVPAFSKTTTANDTTNSTVDETDITDLVGIALPEDGDSSRVFVAVLDILHTQSANNLETVRMRVGPLGTSSDPIVASSGSAANPACTGTRQKLFVWFFTPDSGDKVTITGEWDSTNASVMELGTTLTIVAL